MCKGQSIDHGLFSGVSAEREKGLNYSTANMTEAFLPPFWAISLSFFLPFPIHQRGLVVSEMCTIINNESSHMQNPRRRDADARQLSVQKGNRKLSQENEIFTVRCQYGRASFRIFSDFLQSQICSYLPGNQSNFLYAASGSVWCGVKRLSAIHLLWTNKSF